MRANLHATCCPAAFATCTASLPSTERSEPTLDLGLQLATHAATIGTLVVLVGGVLSWLP